MTTPANPLAPGASPVSGEPPVREVIVPDVDSMVRWFEHDYPHPLARWHWHPEIEIHLIREGRGLALVGDHLSGFSAGHLVMVGSGLPHDWISDIGPGLVISGRDVVLQIHPDRMAQVAGVAPEAAEAVRFFHAARRGIEFTGQTAVDASRELEAMGGASGIGLLSHLFALLTLLARAPDADRAVLASRAATGGPDLGGDPRVDTVLQYLTDTLTDDIRMSDAAALVGMSPSAFSRFFTAMAGRGFSATVRRLRINRACRLLLETPKPVTDICYEVGYANLSNFNRQFRAETGTTPRAYRRTAGSGKGAA
jgi:AraC-like DNA-binding protein